MSNSFRFDISETTPKIPNRYLWILVFNTRYDSSNYYPFGMLMQSRTYQAPSTDGYRFGFNGKEQDNEVSGSGNSYDYGFRIYNSRLAKFLSVDPLTKSYPWLSTYQFAGNTPLWAIDLDGLEQEIITIYTNKDGSTDKTILKASDHTFAEWEAQKRARYLLYGDVKHKDLFWESESEYNNYALTGGDGNDNGWYGPGNGTLTIDATGNVHKLSYNSNEIPGVHTKPVTMAESAEKGVEAFTTFFIKPKVSVERSAAFKSSVDGYVTLVSMPITITNAHKAKNFYNLSSNLSGVLNEIDNASSLLSEDGKTFFQETGGITGDVLKLGLSLYSGTYYLKKKPIKYIENGSVVIKPELEDGVASAVQVASTIKTGSQVTSDVRDMINEYVDKHL